LDNHIKIQTKQYKNSRTLSLTLLELWAPLHGLAVNDGHHKCLLHDLRDKPLFGSVVSYEIW